MQVISFSNDSLGKTRLIRNGRRQQQSGRFIRVLSSDGKAGRLNGRATLCASVISDYSIATDLKQTLYKEVDGINCGIFGIPSAKKEAIAKLIKDLENTNSTPSPLDKPELLHGDWKLLYSTVVISGIKRTKLGLREFVKVDKIIQRIDTEKEIAVNQVFFSVVGLSIIKGSLTITASYKAATSQRVGITFKGSTMEPRQLEKLFEQNYDLLLSIFNPEGYLDITFVDQDVRIGRDDKGNVFFLTRSV